MCGGGGGVGGGGSGVLSFRMVFCVGCLSLRVYRISYLS